MRRLRRFKPLFVAVAVLVGLFFGYQLLLVREISCKASSGECTVREIDILKSQLKKNALTINRKAITNELKKDPRIENIQIDLRRGVTIFANIEYKDESINLKVLPITLPQDSATGSAVLWSRVDQMLQSANASGSAFFKLWENGYMTSIQEVSDFGAVLFAQGVPNRDLLKEIYHHLAYQKQYLPGKIALIQENAILMRIDDRTILLFDVKKDPQKIFETLQQIQAVTTIEEGTRLIDLRFNKPVISLNQND